MTDELVVIDPKTFEKYNHLVNQRTYTNPNLIVRWLYWKRFENLLNGVSVANRSNVLDLGCGEGAFLPTISKRFDSVVALDLDMRAARETVSEFELTNVNIVEGNYQKLSDGDGTFDLVVAASVLEHFKELGDVIDFISSKLKSGGQFIASVPSENFLYQVGRKIFGFKKPVDHYLVPRQIKSAIERRLTIERVQYGPVHLSGALATYVIYHARKK